MYWSDYHVHTHFSADSDESLLKYIQTAQQKGIHEICFTDHFDYNYPDSLGSAWMCDVAGVFASIDALPPTNIKIRKGVEMGVRLEDGIIENTVALLKPYDFDFVLASTHLVSEKDPYYPTFFEGVSRQEAFSSYIETLYNSIQQTDFYCSVGHIDYPSKGCPLEDAALHYDDAPEQLDALFRYVAEQGKMIEINTSILKVERARPRDEVLWKRYVELGNDSVTMGSDAHSIDYLGYEFEQTREFLKYVGVRYIATFEKMTPLFTPV